MREPFLWLAYGLLLAVMAIYTPVLIVVHAGRDFLRSNFDALQLELLMAGAKRRTRNGRKRK